MSRRLLPFLCGLLATGLVGCDWMPGKPTKADVTIIPADVHSFNTLYATYCSGCHGANGQYGGARPLNDPLYLSLASEEYLIEVTTSGVPHSLMPAFAVSQGGDVTSEQITEIIHGIRRSWVGMAEKPGVNPPALHGTSQGNAGRGKTLFGTYCGACHGADGTGAKTAGSVVDSSFLALVSDQALRTAIICGRLDLGMPDWQGQVNGVEVEQRENLSPLTDQQVSDLVAFIISHRVEFPGSIFPSLDSPPGTD